MAITSFANAASGGSNDFSLVVGATGNTTYVLDRTYVAGSYKVVFTNGDTTYDIYAIAENGTVTAYTKTGKITPAADFNKIVVLGAAANENISFLYEGLATSPTTAGDLTVVGAYVTSVGTSSLPNVNDTTTVTGGNFASNVEVYFTGTNAVDLPAKTVVRSSTTSLTVTRPDNLINDNAPYSLKVINPGATAPTGSNAHILSGAITAGNDPTWTTEATLPAGTIGAAYSQTFVASDGEGSITQYQLIGTAPAGLSLNTSTGVLSGTPTAATTYSFVVRAFDSGNNTVDRTFSLTINPPATGGTTYSSGGYIYHKFTASDNLVVSATISNAEVLVVAGGGGGGGFSGWINGGQGGGGAGGVLYLSGQTLTPGSKTVVIGAGGAAGGDFNTTFGANSIFNGNTAIGGGRGGGKSTNGPQDPKRVGGDGGSGGGGASDGFDGLGGGNGTSGQGNAGGWGAGAGGYDPRAGGGGGGAGGVGGNASQYNGGLGGVGTSSYSTWASATASGHSGHYAGGGGGGAISTGAIIGTGGTGGGGTGHRSNGGGSAGSVNTGGGGGGGADNAYLGMAGGSGIVIVRYAL